MNTDSHEFASLGALIDGDGVPGKDLAHYVSEIQNAYRADHRPWVIGYSGGKDSTAVLELVYHALQGLPSEARHKPVFVVSSDTLVETPVVVQLIKDTLDAVNRTARRDGLPITAHQVEPRVDKTFWVNLLGKGYPAPTPQFRWCTENMKINPVSAFIEDKVSRYGEVVVVLGARREESSTRAQVMARHRIEGTRFSRHTSLPNAFVYTPIEDWSADEVWMTLLQAPPPWGASNGPLFELYKGSNQGECPLVIDTSTPSCGNSRFGCWTCTVVTKDRAMESLIASGEHWMRRLSAFRNRLARSNNPRHRHKLRNVRRRTGRITFYSADRIDDDSVQSTEVVHGPYLMKVRQKWLRDLLLIERGLRGTEHEMELITRPELHRIRQEWLNDPNEPDWADTLPKIYREVYCEDLEWVDNDAGAFTQPDAELLAELAATHGTSPMLIMKLLDLELAMDGLSRRAGIFDRIATILRQDWDSLEDVQARRRTEDLKQYATLARAGTRGHSRRYGTTTKKKYRTIYEEVSDKLLGELDNCENHFRKLKGEPA